MGLIIEGCDLSGKTTLSKALGWSIFNKDPSAKGKDSISQCMKLETGYTIWDRWWPSEYIYGKLY